MGGSEQEIGDKNGKYFNLNVPISTKLRDNEFVDLMNKICHRLALYFQPDVIVLCAGCDGLRSDPFNKFNLSINGLCKAVNVILTVFDLPTLILGGGGYNAIDTAKCWTKITSIAANICLSNDVPYHCNFNQFAPHYLLNKVVNNQCNENEDKRSYIYAIQSAYAHLNKFERLFLQNLKRKCMENEIAIKQRMQRKMNEESKEIEDIQTDIIEKDDDEQSDDDNDEEIVVDDTKNNDDDDAVIDDSKCVG